MRSIYLFVLLFASLFALASAEDAVFLNAKKLSSYAYSRDFYYCAARRNFTRMILHIWDEQGKTNPYFLTNFINSRDAQIKDYDAVVTVKDAFEPEAICNGVAHALPRGFNGTVWLEVQNTGSLWSRNVSERVPYLEKIIKSCQGHGLKPGIYSSAESWFFVMGDQEAGSHTLKAVPVWYFNDNQKNNFNDFEYAGFGPWDAPKMKAYGKDLDCAYSITSLAHL